MILTFVAIKNCSASTPFAEPTHSVAYFPNELNYLVHLTIAYITNVAARVRFHVDFCMTGVTPS